MPTPLSLGHVWEDIFEKFHFFLVKKGDTAYFCLPFSQAIGRSVLLKRSTCPGGGIGRRVGLKHQWGNPCGFESHPGYFTLHTNRMEGFFVYASQAAPKTTMKYTKKESPV